MTERWVSNSKHYCQACRIFIDGKASSVRHHELGGRHQHHLREKLKQSRIEKQKNREYDRDLAAIDRAATSQLHDDAAKGLLNHHSIAIASSSSNRTGVALPQRDERKKSAFGGKKRADQALRRESHVKSKHFAVDIDESTGMGRWQSVDRSKAFDSTQCLLGNDRRRESSRSERVGVGRRPKPCISEQDYGYFLDEPSSRDWTNDSVRTNEMQPEDGRGTTPIVFKKRKRRKAESVSIESKTSVDSNPDSVEVAMIQMKSE